MFVRQSHAAARSQGCRRGAAEKVFAQGWWVVCTCCLGVSVSSMRDRAAQLSRVMFVVDWTRFSSESWCVVRCAVAAVCMDVSRWYSIICARAGPDLN